MPDYTSDAELDGELFQFNQNDAIGALQTSDIGLSDYGMAFVPTTCSQGQICKCFGLVEIEQFVSSMKL